MNQTVPDNNTNYELVCWELKDYARELGFAALGVTDIDLGEHPKWLKQWLDDGRHGEMDWMLRHRDLRSSPQRLVSGTLRLLSARMNYLSEPNDALAVLGDGDGAYVARYALGRDYHKVVRRRLAKIAAKLVQLVPNATVRAFSDSAPVLEKAIAAKAGLGWIGKNTLLLNKSAGSLFFLGEIFTDVPLPLDVALTESHCGSCTACMSACPTDAITGPGQLDARRCIAYLTIEHKGDIDESLREKIGNRIFGCDDCQLVCPWNKFAKVPVLADFAPRSPFANGRLLDFWEWSEAKFLRLTEGMALRRLSYEQWRRNLAIALGNMPSAPAVTAALTAARPASSPIVQRHIDWALRRQEQADTG